MAEHDARIERLVQERDVVLQESKSSVNLLKELKDSYEKIEIILRCEIKRAHVEEVKLQEELEACNMIIEAQKKTIVDHDKTVEGHNKTIAEYEEFVKSCDKIISNKAHTISLLQERVARLSIDKNRSEVEKAAVMVDYLELHDTFERKMEKMDDTILNFYVNSLMHKGSLSYLGPKFPSTLVRVWKEMLTRF